MSQIISSHILSLNFYQIEIKLRFKKNLNFEKESF